MEHSYENHRRTPVPPSNTHHKPAITIHPQAHAHIGFFDSLIMGFCALTALAHVFCGAPGRRHNTVGDRS